MPERPSRYEVLTRIASGGMATVYLGRRYGIGTFSRLVAIKKPHSFVITNAELRKRFEREAQVASLLHHPNVVAVLDVAENDGETMLVMEYVDGCTLKDLMNHAQATGERTHRAMLRVLLDVAAGLHAVHCLRDARGHLLGVVHRDVSPQNVLVGRDGIARLADFGVAKFVGFEHEPTVSDGVSGKLAYLAPEYLSAKHFDAQSDLFSLGVVAWEALAGRRLFKGATPMETIFLITSGRAPKLSEIQPALTQFDEVLCSALEQHAEQRPASVAIFAGVLENAARCSDCLASPAEVSALVERVAKDAIAERQRALNSNGERHGAHASSPRDDVVTQTLLNSPHGNLRLGWASNPRRGLRNPRIALAAVLSLSAALLGGLRFRLERAAPAAATFRREPATATRTVPAQNTALAPALGALSATASLPLPPELTGSVMADSRSKRTWRTASKPASSRPPLLAQAQSASTPFSFPERAPPNPYSH